MSFTRHFTNVMAGLFLAAMSGAESSEPRMALSDEIIGAVAASFAYQTPEELEAKRKTDAETYIDKPKNKIIRLPEFIVQEERLPNFREQDIYTPKALTEIALKRYLSDFGRALNAWRIPIIGGAVDSYAMALWAQDERARISREIGRQISFDMITGNEERARELQELLKQRVVRPINGIHPGKVTTRDARGE